jgi:hypothetical protein
MRIGEMSTLLRAWDAAIKKIIALKENQLRFSTISLGVIDLAFPFEFYGGPKG